jgi:hypothetical protein
MEETTLDLLLVAGFIFLMSEKRGGGTKVRRNVMLIRKTSTNLGHGAQFFCWMDERNRSVNRSFVTL